MASRHKPQDGADLPDWVPDDARNYLAHVEGGWSLRALARETGCHASTVMRQVRRIEVRREDPLVDAALRGLGARVGAGDGAPVRRADQENDVAQHIQDAPATDTDPAALDRDIHEALRALAAPGTVLAVARDMDKAVVVADEGAGGATDRRMVIEAATAQAMALRGWIACNAPGRVSRYRITASGRATLGRLMAETESRQRGFADAQIPFDAAPHGAPVALRPARVSAIETPVAALARRRDKSGRAFLDRALVRAAERLREDYEIARLGHVGDAETDALVLETADASLRKASAGAEDRTGPQAALARLAAALVDLGPGLGDMALRCCCRLEGLETAEQRMGWSARSGKIVLRIALQRLARHYEEQGIDGRGLIG
ncbi:helix-turn-helix domain-containing protein [Roseivivax marinus]|uniref:DUF6456 domain-containing protein n=1 Tax=Roseivivax marinus TaxID=1379903 RepID=UPI001F0448FF|nr:DUF6456 domain-containing protein [Roseivivax marinus]UMA66073.1 helix-turn-helix domain-containing protein [Roseivivax marinus]